MRINGQLFTAEFKRWVRNKSEDGKVIDLDPDHVRAQFELAKWESDKGKITLDQIYHTLESLLDIEECLTCSKDKPAFPAELEEVEKALKSYKGKADTTPKRHSLFDEDSGFYPRQ